MEPRKFSLKAIIFGILFLVALIGGCSTVNYELIEQGHEGVKVNLLGNARGVDDMEYVSGYVWYNPYFTKVVEYPITTQTVDYAPFVVSATGTNFTIDPTLAFSVKPKHTAQVYAKYNKTLEEVESTAVLSMIKDAYKNTARHYKADSLILKQSQFEAEVEQNLKEQLETEGFKLDRLTSSITPPKSYQATIDAKNEAVQNALRIENEVASAQAEGKIAIARATAEAQASKIEADAKAYKNEREQQSLTPLLVQQQWINKWNGQVPVYQTGSGTSVLMQMPK